MHDANGEALKVGDHVIIKATVTQVSPQPDFCNCTVKLDTPMAAGREPESFVLNTKQIEKYTIDPAN